MALSVPSRLLVACHRQKKVFVTNFRIYSNHCSREVKYRAGSGSHSLFECRKGIHFGTRSCMYNGGWGKLLVNAT
jgi:hypothetical protein